MKKVSDFLNSIKDWMKTHKTFTALIVTILFVIVHVPLVLNHEISNDEGVVWGLSKRINLSNIYEVNSVEPHPLLWEVILAPFSQMGAPILTMNFISLFFVALAVFLFARFAPFGAIGKTIFILSSSFFYFNPVIARDYSLIPLAICLICMAYKKRHEKPLLYGLTLAFLAQTHFLMYGFLAALVLGFIIETIFEKKPLKTKILAIVILLIPVGLSLVSVVPEAIGSLNNHAIINDNDTRKEVVQTDFYTHSIGSYFGAYAEIMKWLVSIYLVVMFIAIWSEKAKIGAYLAAGVGFWGFVLANVYQNYYVFDQKVIIISLLLLSTAWMLNLEDIKVGKGKILSHIELIKYLKTKTKTRRPAIVLIYLFVALTIPRAVAVAITDYREPYASSNEIAEFINEHIEDGALILEGDATTVYNFTVATYEQVKKDVTFFNVLLNDIDNVDLKLKYDGKDHELYQNYVKLTSEELQMLLDSADRAFEHIYYVGMPKNNCSGEKTRPYADIMDKYEKVGELNSFSYYLEGVEPILEVYKIK